MPERRVLEVLLVLANIDERQLARSLIDRRLAVIGRQPVDRLAQIAAIGMAVGEERIDVGGVAAEIQARLDSFVEHRVRPHLDADEEPGTWTRRGGRRPLFTWTGSGGGYGQRDAGGAGQRDETLQELASGSHSRRFYRRPPHSLPCERASRTERAGEAPSE